MSIEQMWRQDLQACDMSGDGLLNEVQHLRNSTIYVVEELTPEVYLAFCDDWNWTDRARVMTHYESAKARGNFTICRHKPGGTFQWMEIHRSIDEDIAYLMPWLETEAAWSPLNGEAEVHSIHPYIPALP